MLGSAGGLGRVGQQEGVLLTDQQSTSKPMGVRPLAVRPLAVSRSLRQGAKLVAGLSPA